MNLLVTSMRQFLGRSNRLVEFDERTTAPVAVAVEEMLNELVCKSVCGTIISEEPARSASCEANKLTITTEIAPRNSSFFCWIEIAMLNDYLNDGLKDALACSANNQ